MPSVRVRRRGYSTLRDVDPAVLSPASPDSPSSRPRARSDAAALSLSLSPDFSAYNYSAFSDADADADAGRDQPSLAVPLRRTRGSATSASRVSQYVQQSSIRLLSTHTDPAARRTALSSLFSTQTSPRPQSPSESSDRLEGPTASVIVHDSRPLGHVGSALSLPHDNAEANMVDDEHHTDDIVEHLDVVGTSCLTCARSVQLYDIIIHIYHHCRSPSRHRLHPRKHRQCHPHVRLLTHPTPSTSPSTVPSPPLSFYSRKPVLVLPERPQDAEAASAAGSDDELDRHVEDVLTRRARFRRILQGVWAFLKTRAYPFSPLSRPRPPLTCLHQRSV